MIIHLIQTSIYTYICPATKLSMNKDIQFKVLRKKMEQNKNILRITFTQILNLYVLSDEKQNGKGEDIHITAKLAKCLRQSVSFV